MVHQKEAQIIDFDDDLKEHEQQNYSCFCRGILTRP